MLFRSELLVRNARVIDAVFFATDATRFDFQNDVLSGAELQQFLADLHVVSERQFRTVEHVRLEEVAAAFRATLGSGFDQRLEETVDLLGLAVVGMQSDQDVVLRGQQVSSFSQHDAAMNGVLNRLTRSELTSTGRELNDAIGLLSRERVESGVDRANRGDVDRWECVVALDRKSTRLNSSH